MKRIGIGLGIVAVVIAAAFIALKIILNPSFMSEKLREAVLENTGRTLTMTSDPSLSFWPDVALTLQGASLSNPASMATGGQFAGMDELRVRVAVMPLLSRRVDIRELTLVKPTLNLVVDGEGNANWDFARLDTANASSETSGTNKSDALPSGDSTDGGLDSTALDLKVAPIVIENGEVRYLDERAGTAFQATEVNITLTVASLNSPVELNGSLVWNRQPVKLSLLAKSPQEIAKTGTPVDLNLQSPFLNLSFSGRGKLSEGVALAGKLEASTSSIRQLAAWSGTPLAGGNGLQAFEVRAGLDMEGKTIKLSDAVLGLDGAKAQGTVELSLEGERPRLAASLGVDQINIDTYAPPSAKSDSDDGQSAPGDGGWSDAPIDFSGLKAADANLNLSVNEIRYRDVTIGRSAIKSSLIGGVLTAQLTEMAFYDGKAIGKLVLSQPSGKPAIQGALNAQGLNGYRLLKDFAGIGSIEGRTNMTLSLTASGLSQREMVSRLDGSGDFQFTDGAIRGINIARMVRSVDTAILDGWDAGENQSTDFSLLAASFSIADGVATNNDLKMIGPLVRVTGAGTADILKRELDYKVEPKLVASLEGQGGDEDLSGLPVPVIIKGPWSNPRIYPDIQGILSNPQAAFDALSELTGQGGNIKVDDLTQKAKKALTGKAADQVNKVLGDDGAGALNDTASEVLKQQGNRLLKGLFGSGQNQ